MQISQKTLLSIIVALAVILVGYLIWTNIQGETASWNKVENKEYKVSLKYPDNFFDAGHEPKILVGDCNYQVFPSQCPNIKDIVRDKSFDNISAGNAIANNVGYCKYSISDAAAGHQYYYDYYVRTKNQKCIVIELQTTTTTCENYLPLEPGNTEQETNYNTCIAKRNERPQVLEKILSTFKFAN